MRHSPPDPAPDDRRPIAGRRPGPAARAAAFELRALAFAALLADPAAPDPMALLEGLRECTGRGPHPRTAAAVRRIARGGSYLPPDEVALRLHAEADALGPPGE